MTQNFSNNRLQPGKQSALKNYQQRIVGSERFFDLLKYEACTLFLMNLPGALGLLLRQKIYRALIGKLGKSVVISRGVTLRCPQRLSLEEGTLVDENTVFDIKSTEASVSVGAESQIMSGVRFETGYEGSITVGSNSFVGAYTILNGHGGLTIGDNALIAGHCHIIAGNHGFADLNTPMISQGVNCLGIHIEDDVWLGSGVRVLDGVRIGHGSIISAGAVVTQNVEPYSIMGGVPAKLIRKRTEENV
ncbi:acyltransferase [Shimia sp. R9_3]|uniref:acyltransferase n=1 Tax=Shimia sp. R9_3 TaxID=2821113 RepID=UPI001FFE18E5|nr:acyltransferase [Shimia sp. R9_3]